MTQGAILTCRRIRRERRRRVRGKWVLEICWALDLRRLRRDVPRRWTNPTWARRFLARAMEQHRKNPSCSACHNLMDPIGFGLESYDAVGAWRTHDGEVDDRTLDAAGWQIFRGREGLKEDAEVAVGAFTRNVT